MERDGNYLRQLEREFEKPRRLNELQASARRPLIEFIAESLAQGDETAAVLIPWMDTPEGQQALQGILPELIEAYGQALNRLHRS